MELSATQLPGTTTNGNGRQGILHEAPATQHAAVPEAELDGLGFDPEEKAAELEDASAEEALGWALETFNPRMYIASGPASGEGSRSSNRSSSPCSSSIAAPVKRCGFFFRHRSVIRFRATRNNQPVTCSIGISRRFASASS